MYGTGSPSRVTAKSGSSTPSAAVNHLRTRTVCLCGFETVTVTSTSCAEPNSLCATLRLTLGPSLGAAPTAEVRNRAASKTNTNAWNRTLLLFIAFSSFETYQYFTQTEKVPENRSAGVARTPVFGLLLIVS